MSGSSWLASALALCTVCTVLVGQQPAAEDAPPPAAWLEAGLERQAVKSLLAFARLAEGNKVRSRARAAYELVLEYDADQRAARTALGFRREKGGWREAAAGKKPAWGDEANAAQRQRVTDAWEQVQKQLAGLHRTLGLELQSRGEAAAARRHLERAVSFDPGDVEAHRALGHRERRGFFGTAEQIAFLERLAAIEDKARELGSTDCEAEALPAAAMPEELRRTGLPFHGAKSAHVTVWATSPQQDTVELAQWGERAHRMLQFLLGERAAEHDVPGELAKMRWFALLHSDEEREAFLKHNQSVFDIDVSLIADYAGWTIRAQDGRAHVSYGQPLADRDVIVAHVTEHGFAHHCNEGLSEGLVHAMTWLMVGTVHTFYGTLPATYSGRGTRPEDPDPQRWRALLLEQIDRGTDWPLQQIPRERLHGYREQVRIKAWSFVLWLLARHPDQWPVLLHAFPDARQDAGLSPEDSTAILERVLGRTLPEIEAEWREWAAGTSPLAKASGHAR